MNRKGRRKGLQGYSSHSGSNLKGERRPLLMAVEHGAFSVSGLGVLRQSWKLAVQLDRVWDTKQSWGSGTKKVRLGEGVGWDQP